MGPVHAAGAAGRRLATSGTRATTGIRFPKKVTTVFEVKRADGRVYWRATTLDSFTGGRWSRTLARSALAADARPDARAATAVPARRATRQNWVQQRSRSRRSRDEHLVAAEHARRATRLERRRRSSTTRTGIAESEPAAPSRRAYDGLELLAAADAGAARALEAGVPGRDRDAYLEVGITAYPARRSARRTGSAISTACSSKSVYARRCGRTGRCTPGASASPAARKSPYAAAVALERWFRDDAAASSTTSTRRTTPGVAAARRLRHADASRATASTSPARWR